MRNRIAYSLIELLVVVAIIAVLAGMILPTASIIRDLARTAKCASNLRQLGLAYQLYAADNRGWLPPKNANNGPDGIGNTGDDFYYHGTWWPWGTWPSWLIDSIDSGVTDDGSGNDGRMLMLKDLTHCPDSPVTRGMLEAMTDANHRLGFWAAHSYGASDVLTNNWWGYNSDVYEGGELIHRKGSPITYGTPGRKIVSASRTMLLGEVQGMAAGGWPSWGNTAPPWYCPPFDTRKHAFVHAPPELGIGLGSMYPGWQYEGGVRVSHCGRTNRLYVDGRVASERPWDICRPEEVAAWLAVQPDWSNHPDNIVWHGGWR